MTERLHLHSLVWCIGEGNGNRLQCSCLENPRDGGAWWAAIYRVTQSWTRLKQLSRSSSSVFLLHFIFSPLFLTFPGVFSPTFVVWCHSSLASILPHWISTPNMIFRGCFSALVLAPPLSTHLSGLWNFFDYRILNYNSESTKTIC